ncbi:hypothetical protein NE611_17110, partial [Anaerostipes caccae]|uniref:hypothetical protein n=1 Tax=Anaerostipes caccae TaxID=105841 RepID=UPI00210C1527
RESEQENRCKHRPAEFLNFLHHNFSSFLCQLDSKPGAWVLSATHQTEFYGLYCVVIFNKFILTDPENVINIYKGFRERGYQTMKLHNSCEISQEE